MRPVPQIALDFVAQHEACRLDAYADVGGVWTIGYGHTLAVREGASCSRSQANMWLEEDLGIAAKRLASALGDNDWRLLQLTDHQYAALLSFVFNVGANPGWTIWKRLKDGEISTIPGELLRFVYAGGKLVPGLANRRSAEVALWNTPDDAKPQPAPPPPSSAVTRDAVQPSANSGLLSRIWNRIVAA